MSSDDPDPSEAARMLSRLLGEEKIVCNEIHASAAGLRLSPHSPTDLDRIEKIALGVQWIVSRKTDALIAIEPLYTPRAVVLPDTDLFHVTDASNRESIAINGLQPRTGGNTSLRRSYPARLHLCAWLRDAMHFAHLQSTRHEPGWFDAVSGKSTARPPRKLETLDIYRAKAPARASFHVDSHFDNAGIWTEQAIPSDRVELLDAAEWRPLYDQLYPEKPLEEALAYLRVPDDQLPRFGSGQPERGQ